MRKNFQHAPARRRPRLWPPILVIVVASVALVWELTVLSGALIGGVP
jgi:hypothetical protein